MFWREINHTDTIDLNKEAFNPLTKFKKIKAQLDNFLESGKNPSGKEGKSLARIAREIFKISKELEKYPTLDNVKDNLKACTECIVSFKEIKDKNGKVLFERFLNKVKSELEEISRKIELQEERYSVLDPDKLSPSKKNKDTFFENLLELPETQKKLQKMIGQSELPKERLPVLGSGIAGFKGYYSYPLDPYSNKTTPRGPNNHTIPTINLLELPEVKSKLQKIFEKIISGVSKD